MCKEVILIMDAGELNETQLDFNTTGEAIAHAEKNSKGHESFDIYTLFKAGKLGGIQWALSADTASNLREAAKAEALKKSPRTHQRWTELEVEVLKDAYSDGHKITEIAAKLGRPYKSVYSKLSKLGVIG